MYQNFVEKNGAKATIYGKKIMKKKKKKRFFERGFVPITLANVSSYNVLLGASRKRPATQHDAPKKNRHDADWGSRRAQ